MYSSRISGAVILANEAWNDRGISWIMSKSLGQRLREQDAERKRIGLEGSCPSMRWKFGVELERPSVRRPEVELL